MDEAAAQGTLLAGRTDPKSRWAAMLAGFDRVRFTGPRGRHGVRAQPPHSYCNSTCGCAIPLHCCYASEPPRVAGPRGGPAREIVAANERQVFGRSRRIIGREPIVQ